MKHLCSFIFLLGVISIGSAQIINFPDANFKAKLLQANTGVYIAHGSNGVFRKIDTNNNGEIEVSEAASLTYLSVESANISDLTGISYFSNLLLLRCSGNVLTTIDINNLNLLYEFFCEYNQLTNITLPTNSRIERFYCSNNNLTQLDLNLLPHLIEFGCEFNHIQSLVFENKQMNNVSVNNNDLTQLTTTNCRFMSLGAANNNLTEVDLSTCTFQGLGVDSNQLNYMNIKNGNIYPSSVSFGGNPNLWYICINEVDTNNINNLILQYGYPFCNVNSYCSFNPGGTYYTVQGNTRIDSSSNGCDLNDNFFPNLNLSIDNGINQVNFISNTSGNYTIPIQSGNYTITPWLENPNYFTISPTSIGVSFPNQTSPLVQNFCISPNGSHQDVETWIVPLTPARPGFDSRYKIKYKNKGTVPVSGNIIFAFNDDYMDFVSASQIVASQSFSLLTWDYVNLLPYQTREIEVTMNINSPMETLPVNIGDVIKFSSSINPSVGDEYISDNANRLEQNIVGSLDPNDKLCIEGNTVDSEIIGNYVHYVIRFENTGTFAAENIVVKDIIDTDKFDMATLVSLDGSHDFKTRITNSNVVEFIFENINLPFDDSNNDGYVAFKIKTKPSLVVGDTFSNTASIYFDYNFPINTNLFTSTIQVLANQDFDFNTNFNLYPNPTNNLLNIKSTTLFSLYSVSIYNMLGQLIQVETHPTKTIDVSALKQGNYIISITTDKGKSSGRFVKN